MGEVYNFSTFPELTTPRLRLRRLRAEDAAGMVALFGDPRVLRFLNHAPTDTLDKARALIEWFGEHYAAHAGVDWAITLRDFEEDAFIGLCGAHAWDRDNRHVDIGYHVVYDHWGRAMPRKRRARWWIGASRTSTCIASRSTAPQATARRNGCC